MKSWPAVLIFLALPLHAAVYKWVDPDGNVSYSDLPPPGGEAKVMNLPETSRYAPRSQSSTATQGSAATDSSEAMLGSYDVVAIAKPKAEETLYNRDLHVDVEVQLKPALQEGHTLSFVLDGEEIGAGLTGTRMRLENVDRGPHTLTAGVNDAAGELVARSAAVRFYLLTETVIKEPQASAEVPETALPDTVWDQWAKDLESYKRRHATDLQRIKAKQQPIATAPPVPPIPSETADLDADVPSEYRGQFEEYRELSDEYKAAHRTFSIPSGPPNYSPSFQPSYSPTPPPTATPFGAR